MAMDPIVRVICLLAFAASVSRAALPGLFVGGLLLVLVSLWVSGNAWKGFPNFLRRIRWLVFSLVLIYGWFTPGELLIPALGPWSPSVNGLYEGSIRVAALLVMVAAVCLLLRVTVREQLLLALYQVTLPLAMLGFPRERLVARMVLVLETVPRVQELLAAQVASLSGTGPIWQRMAGIAKGVFDSVLLEAERQAIGPVSLKQAAPIPWYQWSYPLFIVLLFQYFQ